MTIQRVKKIIKERTGVVIRGGTDPLGQHFISSKIGPQWKTFAFPRGKSWREILKESLPIIRAQRETH